MGGARIGTIIIQIICQSTVLQSLTLVVFADNPDISCLVESLIIIQLKRNKMFGRKKTDCNLELTVDNIEIEKGLMK